MQHFLSTIDWTREQLDGLLTLAEASPRSYRRLGQSQVLHGHEAWGPMAMAAGRLIVRDFKTMACLNVARP